MAGRGLYDNQTVIKAVSKIESDAIKIIPTELITLAVGGSQVITIVPDENTIMKIENIEIYMPAPSTKGASSGVVYFLFKKGHSDFSVPLLEQTINFNGTIDIRSERDMSTNVAFQRPIAVTDFMDALRNATFDTNSNMSITIQNSTDAVLTNIQFILRVAVNTQLTV